MATLLMPRTASIRCIAQKATFCSISQPIRSTFTTSNIPARQLNICSRTALPSFQKPTPSSILQRNIQHNIRNTTRAYATTPTTPASQSPSTNTTSPDVLTWDRFFVLRRRRRWINLVASAVCAAAAVGAGVPVIASQDIDTWGAQLSGIDPIFVFGVSTFAVAVLGWLCGPAFGGAAFGIWAGRRGWTKVIAEKEKSFFSRIKRYRADPSASSPQNPVPDYYGEKVGSVKAYRRWLKDQRVFNRKMNRGVRTTYGLDG